MLKFDKILTEDQSKLYSSKVSDCKDLFNTYADNKFSILGAASYANNLEEYNLIKNKINPVIKNNFLDLLNIIKDYIEQGVNEPCYFDENLSYPGFHTFYADHKDSLLPLTSLHIDTPYQLHKDYLLKKYNHVDFDFPITFTLCLKLPKSGAGLYYWDKDNWDKQTEEQSYEFYSDIYEKYAVLFKTNTPTREDYEKFIEPKILSYEIGSIVLFKGNLLHQIAPFYSPIYSDELRITMQGHGIKCDGKWLLYF
jgi:hypothetical protein